MFSNDYFSRLRRHRSVVSYLWDVLFIILLAVPYIFLAPIVPYERVIFPDDRSIMYPMKTTEIVPTWMLVIICFFVPLVVLLIWMAVTRLRNKKLGVVFIGLLLSVVLTMQITLAMKAMSGRPRPDFLARCDPDPAVTTSVVCRGNKKIIDEGRRSFPSGHSSCSFAGLGYLGYFISGQLAIFNGEGHAWKLVVSSSPFIFAGMVAISRVMDYRHHWQDVLVGSLLGIIIAYISYRMYFPSISSASCREPLDTRFKRLEEEEAELLRKEQETRSVGNENAV